VPCAGTATAIAAKRTTIASAAGRLLNSRASHLQIHAEEEAVPPLPPGSAAPENHKQLRIDTRARNPIPASPLSTSKGDFVGTHWISSCETRNFRG
jgi:hypothetical protein